MKITARQARILNELQDGPMTADEINRTAAPRRSERPGPDTDRGEPSMQTKPNPLIRWLTSGLVIVLVVGVAWAIIAGLKGYTLGEPPTGLDAVSTCNHITRVDFVIPMWKPANPALCGGGGGAAAPTAAECRGPGEHWKITVSAPNGACVPDGAE